MSSAHEPIARKAMHIERVAQGIVDGECEATKPELVATFQLCTDNHFLRAREHTLEALGNLMEAEWDCQ